MSEVMQPVFNWFQEKGWDAKEFQLRAWQGYLNGLSGLIHVSTGQGKTYAGILAPLMEMKKEKSSPEGIQILYVAPLRALVSDIVRSIEVSLLELNLSYTVESRTGDTTAYERARQKKNPPTILVTTPESLNLLIATEEFRQSLQRCRLIIVDEWHELMGNKRGVQLQLCLEQIKKLSPKLRLWGLSATIGNPELAGHVLNGDLDRFVFVTEELQKEMEVEALLPDEIDSFPWAGHLGLSMIDKVLHHINLNHSCLIFTNVRSQCERWHNEILLRRPDWAPIMAIHHSSIDREKRDEVERKIKEGELKLVVCTSSLDLGVDFPRVERVYQIGSPKSISRFIQRAGRSGHTPSGVPRIFFVPTHALEIFEYLATELAMERGLKEDISPPELSLDVLTQHLMTLAAAGELTPDETFEEIKKTFAFRNLERSQFDHLLLFLTQGGRSLSSYPHYHKLKEKNGKFLIHDKRMLQDHLMNVGTITSDPAIRVCYLNGGSLGSVEESFVSKLKKGDHFIFSGKVLEYVLLKNLTLMVRSAPPNSSVIPVWWGARLPISSLLGQHLREVFSLIEEGKYAHPLLETLAPITEVQKALSRLPGENFLLAEETLTREGKHLFLFPFEGRLVHEALAALLSVRLAQRTKVTFSFSVSEYGLEILAPKDYQFHLEEIKEGLSLQNLSVDIQKSLNMTQLAKKQFRDIAQISGLIHQQHRGERRTMKNLQMSSSLLFDVFSAYEPEQPLYSQSFQEVRFFQFQENRLVKALERLEKLPVEHYKTSRPSPIAFPLIIERMSSLVSSETLQERLQRMKEQWTK